MDAYNDGPGVVGSGKYLYQSSRAFRGLSTTTKLTAGIDLLKGGHGLHSAAAFTDVASHTATTAKGLAGTAKLSKFAKVARFAGKAAPVVAKGSAVIGAALGGWEIGQGINEVRSGNTQKGKEKIISGSADVITAGALGVAATSSATVVGLPVAGVALGVAGAAQAAKYGYKHRHQIAGAAKWTGKKIAAGAKWTGNKIAAGAKWTGNKIATGAKKVVAGAKWAGSKIADGAEFAGDKIADGAKWAGKKVSAGFDAIKDGISSVWNRASALF